MKVIELTKGMVTIVDDEDFERIAQWRWHFSHGYAVRKDPSTKKTIMMHKVITNTDSKQFIDHKNGNPLDNRRCNLRPATTAQNRANGKTPSHNQLGIKGVTFMRKHITNPYRAQICAAGKHKTLGYFQTPQEAHDAYCKAAVEAFGEFARFN